MSNVKPDPQKHFEAVLFILDVFGVTNERDARQGPPYLYPVIQSAIEGLTGNWSSYAEITYSIRYL